MGRPDPIACYWMLVPLHVDLPGVRKIGLHVEIYDKSLVRKDWTIDGARE